METNISFLWKLILITYSFKTYKIYTINFGSLEIMCPTPDLRFTASNLAKVHVFLRA